MKQASKCLLDSLALLTFAVQFVFAQNANPSQPASGPSSLQLAATQQATGNPARFEVASVRLSPPNGGGTSINNSGSPRFMARNATLELLVGLSYGISARDITGGPKWFDSQSYDVEAKAEGDAPLTPKQFQPLLQQLLKDRFHLAVHRKTVYRSGYALVVARDGPRLKPGKASSHMGYVLQEGMRFESASTQTLAGVLSSVVDSPVVDKTGIAGQYSIDLKYAPANATESPLPSIYTALEEDLGLKLVPDKKVPVEILVIDHVERIPSED